jgi:hypothetical protein
VFSTTHARASTIHTTHVCVCVCVCVRARFIYVYAARSRTYCSCTVHTPTAVVLYIHLLHLPRTAHATDTLYVPYTHYIFLQLLNCIDIRTPTTYYIYRIRSPAPSGLLRKHPIDTIILSTPSILQLWSNNCVRRNRAAYTHKYMHMHVEYLRCVDEQLRRCS